MSVPENPLAFPVSSIDGFTQHGMTLRDYYAGQALANSAICTGEAKGYQLTAWFGPRTDIMRHEIVAKQAFDHADAMLLSRHKSSHAGEEVGRG